jgi:hypothetical protein
LVGIMAIVLWYAHESGLIGSNKLLA